MSKIKIIVKKMLSHCAILYDIGAFIVNKEERRRWKARKLVNSPEKHCNYIREKTTLYGYGDSFPRTNTISLSSPRLFNEKLLWLKYYKYNKSSLVSRCYDKYLVREYVKEAGCGDILNELYGVWDDYSKVDFEALPDECVLKVSNGCGDIIFKRGGKWSQNDLDSFAEPIVEHQRKQLFKTTGDLFATKEKQRIICEKMLKSNLGYSRPEDYKFYCFNGEPKFLLYIFDRTECSVYKETFKDVDFNDRSYMFYKAENISLERPQCYAEMLEICRKLSKPFPFVRVDLYVQDNKPVFGELTFTPAGSHVLYHVFKPDGSINYPVLEELGGLLDISNY